MNPTAVQPVSQPVQTYTPHEMNPTAVQPVSQPVQTFTPQEIRPITTVANAPRSCGDDAPFWNGYECISCYLPHFWNAQNLSCDSCEVGTNYDVTVKQCVVCQGGSSYDSATFRCKWWFLKIRCIFNSCIKHWGIRLLNTYFPFQIQYLFLSNK